MIAVNQHIAMNVHGYRAGLEFVSALFVLVAVLVFRVYTALVVFLILDFEHGHANLLSVVLFIPVWFPFILIHGFFSASVCFHFCFVFLHSFCFFGLIDGKLGQSQMDKMMLIPQGAVQWV